MTITVKHAKTNAVADWTQADLDAQIALGNFAPGTTIAQIVIPSDWNNDHTLTGTIDVANGGTGQSTYTNGQLLIGNTTGNTLTKATLTAGTGISITNGTGSITIANTSPESGPGGSTTQVQYNNAGAFAGSANLTFNGTTLTATDITDTGLTANRVVYAGTGGNLTNSANLQFTGSNLLIGQTYDQSTGALQVTGTSTQNGNVVDKALYLQGGNNLLLQSQFNGTWNTANSTVTANSVVAPNGTTTAATLIPTAVSGTHGIVQSVGVIGNQYTYSVYGKSNGYTNLQLYADSSGNFNATFDLTAGTAASTGGATVSIVSVGNGWYRCIATFTMASSTRLNIQGFPTGATANNFGNIFTGNGTSGISIWGAQLELGTVASNYTPTTTAAITTTNNISVPSGSITTSADATINGLTVGNGGGAVAGNTAVGNAALAVNTTGTQNTALGSGALGLSNTTGSYNTAVGLQALYRNTGDSNTAVGRTALTNNSSGTRNTAVGQSSSAATTTGSYNTTVGDGALAGNQTSSYNTGVGQNAALSATGAQNTILGALAGYSGTNNLTTGSNNTIIGYNAAASSATVSNEITLGNASVTSLRVPGIAATFGTDNSTISTLTVGKGAGAVVGNTAIGVSALGNNTTGGGHVAVGYQALLFNTTGAQNIAVGLRALYSNTTGSDNVSLGNSALNNNTTGNSNIGIGNFSLEKNTLGSNNTSIGGSALNNNTTAVATLGSITGGSGYTNGTYTGVVMTLSSGSSAGTYPTATIVISGGAVTTVTITSAGVGFKDTTTVLTAPAASIGGTGSGFTVPVATLATGGNNTAVGYQALNGNTTASNNTALGFRALLSNTTGASNTSVGLSSLQANTTGASNIALGVSSLLANTTGSRNLALGNSALQTTTTANENIAIGDNALTSNTASQNIAIGYRAGTKTTSGNHNTVIGTNAGVENLTGVDNTAIGFQALNGSTASSNIGIGSFTGQAITSGAQNTLLGTLAGYSGTNNLTTGSNNIIIGYNAAASSATVSNEVTIGNDSIVNTRLKGQVGVGLTPSTWAGLSYNAVEINTAGNAIFSGTSDIWYLQNAYYNSGWKYGPNGQSAAYNQNAGIHNWKTAASGSANAALTWLDRMRIHNSGGVSIGNTTDPGAGNLSVTGTVRTQGYTVATLPAAGTIGRRAYVTDALAPTYLGALTGGGAINCPVFDNGTIWVSA